MVLLLLLLLLNENYFFFLFRNYFLDFDAWGLMSAVEQNFDPSRSNILRQTTLGYPRLLSGDYNAAGLSKLVDKEQYTLFPETSGDTTWTKTDLTKRYALKFPFYPFRTLCPRDLHLTSSKPNAFDNASPIFPANTQLNIVFQKRQKNNFLPYMLPLNLDPSLGASGTQLSEENFTTARTFTTPGANDKAVRIQNIIDRVEINVKNMYMQVSFSAVIKRAEFISYTANVFFFFFFILCVCNIGVCHRNDRCPTYLPATDRCLHRCKKSACINTISVGNQQLDHL